jgi:hypothetical protein
MFIFKVIGSNSPLFFFFWMRGGPSPMCFWGERGWPYLFLVNCYKFASCADLRHFGASRALLFIILTHFVPFPSPPILEKVGEGVWSDFLEH